MTPREVAARLLNVIKLARVTMVDDSRTAQTVQVKLPTVGPDGNPLAAYPRFSDYGFTSSPPVGSEAVVASLWGDRTHGMVVATNHQASRPTGLSADDTMLYTARGQRVWLAAGKMIVDGGGLEIVVQNFSSCTVNGDLNVTGDVIANSATAPVSLTRHLHPLQGPGVPQTGAPLPE